jgi:4-hydroxy-tetrahydrodipicolinate synthase
MAKKLPFTGAGVAIITPFDGDKTNYDELGRIIEDQISGGTDAIIICGTTGEASTMPDAEHLAAIEYTVKKVAGRIPVVAGTGSNDTAHAIELSKKAEELGADAILSVTPYYNKASQKGLVTHFSAIANAITIPVILYNVPSRTGVSFGIDTLKELAKIENIVAIKEASGNISYTAKVAAEVPELYIYSGNDDMIVPILSLGGKGVISVLSNVMPKETHDICRYYFEGNVDRSRTLQLKLLDLINKLFIEVNPIPVKTAMNMLGYNAGNLRLPLCEMEPKNKEALKQAMLNVGLNIKED